ncbi:MAG: leucine-rich repeat protein [Treponema sp.]|nr:leucine-rich repeat protein [Treponema sp.]
MFANCTALTKIDLSAWEKPEKTIYMQSTFSGCTNLTEIDFGSNFSKAEVAIFKETFSGCEKLSALDVSGFDTGNAIQAAVRAITPFCRELQKCFGKPCERNDLRKRLVSSEHCRIVPDLEGQNDRRCGKRVV